MKYFERSVKQKECFTFSSPNKNNMEKNKNNAGICAKKSDGHENQYSLEHAIPHLSSYIPNFSYKATSYSL